MTGMERDAELQAILDIAKALRLWGRRAVRFAWSALFGRVVVAILAFGLLAGLAMFARPGVPADLPKVHVRFDQAYDLDGRPVTRTEWINRACGADGSLCG